MTDQFSSEHTHQSLGQCGGRHPPRNYLIVSSYGHCAARCLKELPTTGRGDTCSGLDSITYPSLEMTQARESEVAVTLTYKNSQKIATVSQSSSNTNSFYGFFTTAGWPPWPRIIKLASPLYLLNMRNIFTIRSPVLCRYWWQAAEWM